MQRQLKILSYLVLATFLAVVLLWFKEPRAQVYLLDGAGYPVPEAGSAPAALRQQVMRSILIRAIADARTQLGRGFPAAVLNHWASSAIAPGVLESLPRQVGETRVEVISARELSPADPTDPTRETAGDEAQESLWEVHWREIAASGLSKAIVARFRVMTSDQWRSSLNPLGVAITAMLDHQIDLSSPSSEPNLIP
jgi:hypothetical protein